VPGIRGGGGGPRRRRRGGGARKAHGNPFACRDGGPLPWPRADRPAPEQLRGRAGDLLLAHYLLGHNIGGNDESELTRRALYFRVSAAGHASRQEEFLRQPWLEYEPIRSRAGRRS
jgi:hypothetical protein